MSGSEDEAAPVTKAEFSRLLTAIAGIQDQMQSMKRELVEDREAANERLVKRIRLDKAPSFKKKGHEKQFRFNEEVREKIAAASDCIKVLGLVFSAGSHVQCCKVTRVLV